VGRQVARNQVRADEDRAGEAAPSHRPETHRRTLWPALLVCAACLACSGAGTDSFDDSWLPADDGPGLAYRLRLESLGLTARVRVQVCLDGRGSPLSDPLRLSRPHRWAFATDLAADLDEFQAWDEAQQPLALSLSEEELSVSVQGATRVCLSYRVAPRARNLTAATRFHALGAPELFFAYGRNWLVQPLDASPNPDANDDGGVEPAEAARAWLRLDSDFADTVWATTLGVFQPGSTLASVPLSELLDAAYLAGRPRLLTGVTPSSGVTLAVDARLPQLDDGLLEVCERVVAYQNALYGPPPSSGTVVLVLWREDAAEAMTGSGRRGGFVLELGEAIDASTPGLAELVAHEHLHRYLGQGLTFAAGSQAETLWFKEGAVSYLAAQTAVRAGVVPLERFWDAVARAVTGYWGRASLWDAEDEAVTALGLESEAGRRLPYDQGFLLALWLDLRLRAQGDSLERAVGELLRTQQTPLDAAALEAFWETRLPDLESFWPLVRGQSPLPWEAWLAEAGLMAEQRRLAAPYYGLVIEARRDGSWEITGLDRLGPAAAQGLDLGMRLVAPPHIPDAGLAAAEVWVESATGPVSVRVPASPGERLVWCVAPVASDAAERFGFGH
jgi:hypothetical protein